MIICVTKLGFIVNLNCLFASGLKFYQIRDRLQLYILYRPIPLPGGTHVSKLNPEDVAIVIKARKILNAQGLAPDKNVKTICQTAGLARKTGYQWTNKLMESSDVKQLALREEIEELFSKCFAVLDRCNKYAN